MLGLTTGFRVSPAQAAMLAEFKAYLDERFRPEHEGMVGASPEWFENFEWVRQFNREMYEAGWLACHWPTEYGGRGLTAIDQMLLREELFYRRVPIVNANGLDMVAAILLMFGTKAQKDQHLRAIGSMEELWCQGYSEPECGSDLTHLRTTAIRDGDEYVINGSKMWTGHAQHAHWMILLCRTDPSEKGSRGLSLLMVDLRNTEGIEIHPIRSITGRVTFCQEFFDNARVPVANLLGPENGGWHVGAALLDHERAGAGSRVAGYRRMLDDLLEVAALRGGVRESTKVEIAKLIEKIEAAQAIAYSTAEHLAESDRFPPHMPSVLKILGAEMSTRLVEVAAEVLSLDITEFHLPDRTWDFWQEFMYNVPSGLVGGSSEIQYDLIAARHLGISR